jgi:alpha-amylase/alpha-mannosidase (GH57 family)
MTVKALCIHGHFYQPPRDDPLTGEIPIEAGASPFRNWNERINDQCYRPNAALGNFEKISFNIGPTLVEWLASKDPLTLSRIIAQDKTIFDRYGVGNAMAQSYNHTILPLSPRHDKTTQVLWGIADFEYRYGHSPAGMWLPETAVDLETLEVLAECGIKFTILAPWQADSSNLDTSQPYRVSLPGKKEISIFFYNQDLSTRISFDPGSTVNGDRFLLEAVYPKFDYSTNMAEKPQIAMIATDGEVYGHHQPFRDKFLEYLVKEGIKGKPIELTFPALWLQQHPARKKMKIHENTSWSCHHGVLRWSGDCDCTPNSQWKAPLREAFNQIAGDLDAIFESAIKSYHLDPWVLRNRYIDIILKKMSVPRLVNELSGLTIKPEDVLKIDRLLRSQWERQRLFTSCGWFFDDFDRIEPRNNVCYAAQAVWLTYFASGIDLSPKALSLLKTVKSWRTGLTADTVFARQYERTRSTMHFSYMESPYIPG